MRIDSLKASRETLAGKLADVSAARDRLRAAQGEETAILAEIGRLGAGEIEALSVWARTGEGPKPMPDTAARASLNERLVSAQLAAEQARAAGISLDDDQRQLGDELSRVNDAIDIEALDALVARHAIERANIAAIVRTRIVPRIARAAAFHAYLIERAKQHQSSGRSDAATALFQRAAKLEPADINLEPAPGEVVGKIATWSARYSEITGSAPDNVVPIIDPQVRQRQLDAGEGVRPIPLFVPPKPAMLPGLRSA